MPHVEEAKKRRDQKVRRTRKRQTLTLLSVAMTIAIIAGLGYYIVNLDFWLIKNITVTGNERLSAKQVMVLSGIDYKTNLLSISKQRIVSRLKREPWIEEAQLGRELPDHLLIDIKERVPFAGVKKGGKIHVLDKNGFVIKSPVKLTTDTTIPIISDIKTGRLKVGNRTKSDVLIGALKSLEKLDPELRSKINWVLVPSLEKLSFQTVDGLEVIFGGPGNAAKKNYVIKQVLNDPGSKIVHINVTAPENPVVRKLKT